MERISRNNDVEAAFWEVDVLGATEAPHDPVVLASATSFPVLDQCDANVLSKTSLSAPGQAAARSSW